MNWRPSSGVKAWRRCATGRETPLRDESAPRALSIRLVLGCFLSRRKEAPRCPQRQADLRSTTGTIHAIGNLKKNAVGLAYLPRQGQADAASSRLGGVKGHEQVRWIDQTDPIVLDQSVDRLRNGSP